LRCLRKCGRRRRSEEEEEEDEYDDDYLHGDDSAELEKVLWEKFEELVEKDEIKKRGGKPISEAELRRIMPTDAFSLRLFNNQRRLKRELSATERVQEITILDIRYLTGLTKAQANHLLERVHDEFNTEVDPEKLRNRLVRIATAKCNQQVFALLGRSIEFNVALQKHIQLVEERSEKLMAAGGTNRDTCVNNTATLSEVSEIYAEAKKIERLEGPLEDDASRF